MNFELRGEPIILQGSREFALFRIQLNQLIKLSNKISIAYCYQLTGKKTEDVQDKSLQHTTLDVFQPLLS